MLSIPSLRWLRFWLNLTGLRGQSVHFLRAKLFSFQFPLPPHLVELYMRHRQSSQQVVVDRVGMVRRTPEPAQHRFFRDPEHKADACQIHADQEHFESHHEADPAKSEAK